MRIKSSFLSMASTLALVSINASCGGSDAAGADPFALIQANDFSGAIKLIEPRLETVAKGTPEHKELVLLYTEALAADAPDKAEKQFIAAMDANDGMLEPKDVRYVVDRMVAKGHLIDAIDVMHHGNQTWPENETMTDVLAELKKVVMSSDDEGATAHLKGMGYL